MGTPRPAEGVPPYQGEFLVGNLNVEELLPEAVQEQFVQAVSTVWEHDDVHIINITSALDRGGRVPLPIEGRKEGYGAGLPGGGVGDGDGGGPVGPTQWGWRRSGGVIPRCPRRVYVKVGSHAAFSPCLVAASSPQSRFHCHLGQQPLANCYDTFAPHFAIRWCNLTLVRAAPRPPPTPHPRAVPDGDLPLLSSCRCCPPPRHRGRCGVPGCWRGAGISSPPPRPPPRICCPLSW